MVSWLLFGGCGQPPPPARVHLLALDDQGDPLAGVKVRLDGDPRGETDDEGGLWLHWSGRLQGRFELSVRCPEGYRSPEPRQLRARHSGARRIRVRCEAAQHRAYLAIAAPGAQGLPVTVDGEHVADIPDSGVLHAQVVRPTGSEVRVRIDTTTRPGLRPQNPVVEARLDRDEVVVLHQRFERARKGRRRRSGPVRGRPKRLRSL